MKTNCLFFLFFLLLSLKSNAQTVLYHPKSLNNYKDSSKWVTVIDQINDIRLKPGTDTTLLYLGGFFSNHVLTVIIKNVGEKFKKITAYTSVNKEALIQGNIIEYEGKPAIVIRDTSQINVSDKKITNYKL